MEMTSLLIYTLGILIEYVGIAIVVVAVFIAIFQLVLRKAKREKIRAELAKNVIFGIEFIIAADILLVTIATGLNDVLQLGGIVLIRLVMGYALKKENL